MLLGDETSVKRTLKLEFRKAWQYEILIKMCVNSSVGKITAPLESLTLQSKLVKKPSLQHMLCVLPVLRGLMPKSSQQICHQS